MCLLHPRGAKTHVSTLTHTQTSYSLPLDTDNHHTPVYQSHPVLLEGQVHASKP